MATLFSLNDAGLFLEVPGFEALRLKNRVVSIETLEGTDSRMVGSSASDLSFALETELDRDKLFVLYRYFQNGAPVGYSEPLAEYACLVSSFESRRKTDNCYAVKISLAVTGEI